MSRYRVDSSAFLGQDNSEGYGRSCHRRVAPVALTKEKVKTSEV
jgi:hypothetical protein